MNYNAILAGVTVILAIMTLTLSNPSLITRLISRVVPTARYQTLAEDLPPEEHRSYVADFEEPVRSDVPLEKTELPIAFGFDWKIAGILFVTEVVGVLASFYLLQPVLKSGQNVIVLSLIVAAANLAGSLSARVDGQSIKPLEALQHFKDGLLWPAALPAIAKAVGLAAASASGQS